MSTPAANQSLPLVGSGERGRGQGIHSEQRIASEQRITSEQRIVSEQRTASEPSVPSNIRGRGTATGLGRGRARGFRPTAARGRGSNRGQGEKPSRGRGLPRGQRRQRGAIQQSPEILNTFLPEISANSSRGSEEKQINSTHLAKILSKIMSAPGRAPRSMNDIISFINGDISGAQLIQLSGQTTWSPDYLESRRPALRDALFSTPSWVTPADIFGEKEGLTVDKTNRRLYVDVLKEKYTSQPLECEAYFRLKIMDEGIILNYTCLVVQSSFLFLQTEDLPESEKFLIFIKRSGTKVLIPTKKLSLVELPTKVVDNPTSFRQEFLNSVCQNNCWMLSEDFISLFSEYETSTGRKLSMQYLSPPPEQVRVHLLQICAEYEEDVIMNCIQIRGPGFSHIVLVLKNRIIIIPDNYTELRCMYGNALEIKTILNSGNLSVDFSLVNQHYRLKVARTKEEYVQQYLMKTGVVVDRGVDFLSEIKLDKKLVTLQALPSTKRKVLCIAKAYLQATRLVKVIMVYLLPVKDSSKNTKIFGKNAQHVSLKFDVIVITTKKGIQHFSKCAETLVDQDILLHHTSEKNSFRYLINSVSSLVLSLPMDLFKVRYVEWGDLCTNLSEIEQQRTKTEFVKCWELLAGPENLLFHKNLPGLTEEQFLSSVGRKNLDGSPASKSPKPSTPVKSVVHSSKRSAPSSPTKNAKITEVTPTKVTVPELELTSVHQEQLTPSMLVDGDHSYTTLDVNKPLPSQDLEVSEQNTDQLELNDSSNPFFSEPKQQEDGRSVESSKISSHRPIQDFSPVSSPEQHEDLSPINSPDSFNRSSGPLEEGEIVDDYASHYMDDLSDNSDAETSDPSFSDPRLGEIISDVIAEKLFCTDYMVPPVQNYPVKPLQLKQLNSKRLVSSSNNDTSLTSNDISELKCSKTSFKSGTNNSTLPVAAHTSSVSANTVSPLPSPVVFSAQAKPSAPQITSSLANISAPEMAAAYVKLSSPVKQSALSKPSAPDLTYVSPVQPVSDIQSALPIQAALDIHSTKENLSATDMPSASGMPSASEMPSLSDIPPILDISSTPDKQSNAGVSNSIEKRGDGELTKQKQKKKKKCSGEKISESKLYDAEKISDSRLDSMKKVSDSRLKNSEKIIESRLDDVEKIDLFYDDMDRLQVTKYILI